MSEVFISYAREDQAVVRVLAEAVKRAGYAVWWDDELPPHLSYGDVITEKIGSAKAAIVVWSEKAAASEWVRAEADVARNQKKLIQTSIDGRQPPMPFNQIQFAAIGDWRGEEDHPGWRKVQESLAALCGRAEAGERAYAFPAGAPPAPPSRPTGTPRLLVALLALLILIILAGGALLLMRETPVATAPPPPAPVVASPPSAKPVDAVAAPDVRAMPQRPAETRARPAAAPAPRPARTAQAPPRAPVNLRQARRYCMGPGHGSAECAALRRQYLGY